jgi:hypothetical protein
MSECLVPGCLLTPPRGYLACKKHMRHNLLLRYTRDLEKCLDDARNILEYVAGLRSRADGDFVDLARQWMDEYYPEQPAAEPPKEADE